MIHVDGKSNGRWPRLLGLVTILSALAVFPVLAQAPDNFAAAKRHVYSLFTVYPFTLYCGCLFDNAHYIDYPSCGMQPQPGSKRAFWTEIEHMMPMENITRHFECGRKPLCRDAKGRAFGGRQCCRQIDPQYRRIEAELYNLWPVIGSVNQARRTYRFAEFSEEEKADFLIPGCESAIDVKYRRFEPRDEAKGIVARANLFMSERYGIRLSPQQRALLESWHERFAPETWEQQWAAQIEVIEGYPNTWIVGQQTHLETGQ